MKNYFRKNILLGILLLLSGVIFSQKTIGEHLDKLGNRYVKKKKNHALVIGIIRGEATSIKTYGTISKQNKTAPDSHSIFEIGAVTSVFTTSLMQLQTDKNKFQSHDPVHIYLEKNRIIPAFHPLKCVEINLIPDMTDQTYRGERPIYRCYEDPMGKAECITFCDLAAHVSGLPSSPKNWYKWKPIGRNKLTKDYQDYDVESFFNKLQGMKLENIPGVKYQHSDFGIALLGNAMSDIAGISYDQLLTEELLQPLDMKNTKVDFPINNETNLLVGHTRKGKAVPAWNFASMTPAAGLKSNMNDLLKFVEANLRPPTPELENAFAEVQQNKVNILFGKNGRVTSMGYGWYTSTLNEETNLPVIWINGGTGGFRTFIGIVKDTQTAVVILSNSANSVDKMGFDILEILNAATEVEK